MDARYIPPEVLKKPLDEAAGKKLPFLIYEKGERHVVGEAVIHPSDDGVIAQIKIDGEYALDILKDGLSAFSIGFPPDHIDAVNRNNSVLPPPHVKPPRWMRRLKENK